MTKKMMINKSCVIILFLSHHHLLNYHFFSLLPFLPLHSQYTKYYWHQYNTLLSSKSQLCFFFIKRLIANTHVGGLTDIPFK